MDIPDFRVRYNQEKLLRYARSLLPDNEKFYFESDRVIHQLIALCDFTETIRLEAAFRTEKQNESIKEETKSYGTITYRRD